MKVLLIQPVVAAEAAYPMALASMIPGLLGAGHQVWGVDEHFESVEDMLALAREQRVDWIGATVVEHNADRVGELFARLRKVCDARYFVSGMWPSIHPASALRRTGADVAILGDAEDPVVALIDTGRPGVGTAHMNGDELEVYSSNRTRELQAVPLMDREVFPLLRYSYAMRSTASPYAMTFTSRGCQKSCPYCPSPAQHSGRYDSRPADQVVDEFEQLVHVHGIRAIHIEDDAFLTERDRVVAICDAIIERGLSVKWELVNGVRAEHVDEELLQLMARAGCSRVVYSFEHLTVGPPSEVGVEMAVARRVVRYTRAAGIRVAGYFIVGLPNTGSWAALRSVRAALGLDLDDANFIPFHAIPGSTWGELPKDKRWSERRSHLVAVAASASFFLRPRTMKNLSVDLLDEPKTLGALGAKALELLAKGGPVPVRDQP